MSREKGGGWLAQELSLASGGHVLEHVAVLLPQRRNHGENPRDKQAPWLALRPEARAPPQNGLALGALGAVVGQLDTRFAGEVPQRFLMQEQLLAERLGLARIVADALHQEVVHLAPHWRHLLLELRKGQRLIPDSMPGPEQATGLHQQRLGESRAIAAHFHKLLKVAPQVTPAQLPPGVGNPQVRAPSIRNQRSFKRRAKHRLADFLAAVPGNDKNRHERRHRDPQPRLFVLLPPTRFVLIDHPCGLDCLHRLRNRRGHGLTDRLLEPGHRPQRQLDAQKVAEQLLHHALAQAVLAGQDGHQGTVPWTEGALGNSRRQLRARRKSTVLAHKLMATVLRDMGGQRRHLDDLMELRRLVGPDKRPTAVRADCGDQRHLFGYLLGRQQGPRMAGVARLGAAFAAGTTRRLLGRKLFRRRLVRRDLEMPVQLRLQLRDPRQGGAQLLIPQLDLGLEQLDRRVSLGQGRVPLGNDRVPLGQLRAQLPDQKILGVSASHASMGAIHSQSRRAQPRTVWGPTSSFFFGRA